jgi:hypothetical protein
LTQDLVKSSIWETLNLMPEAQFATMVQWFFDRGILTMSTSPNRTCKVFYGHEKNENQYSSKSLNFSMF